MLLIGILGDDTLQDTALEEAVRFYLESKQIACRIQRHTKGIEFIRSRTVYDLVFMDDSISDMSIQDAAHFLRIVNKEAQPVVVSHRYPPAVYLREIPAAEFISKPIEYGEVERAAANALKKLESRPGRRFGLKTQGGIVNLFSDSVYYIEVYDHDLLYHTENGSYKTHGRLESASEKLKDCAFVRCNRSYLVNLRHIQRLYSDHLIVNGTRIQIARSRYKAIEKRFIDYLGECM